MRKTFQTIAALAAAPNVRAVQYDSSAIKAAPGSIFQAPRQFNFKRAGGTVWSRNKRLKNKKLRSGGIHKHFNKKRHGRNLRRAHARAK